MTRLLGSIRSGTLFVISAPSGTGKTSLVKALVESRPNLNVSVSHTTRMPRPGEIDGIDYHFVSQEQFMALKADNEFLENASVFDNFYGTSRNFVANKLKNFENVMLEIDWQGAAQVKQNMPDAVSIFILPPSLAVLEQRLRNRKQDSDEIIARRLRDAHHDIAQCKNFDYIVMNDDFSAAIADVKTIFHVTDLHCDKQLQQYGALFGLDA
ncbi:MAG: guanylate kinase [Gammaproteobacteria bacterium]|nr:guanylate kinase [Gammaproteobacteria bacterium]PCH63517.1 MAG: guanylate kinase [Gammaproteobacteria bacterium]PCH64987.1 MAG: guanylate kinase [Gammaproteobacteria bacterium]